MAGNNSNDEKELVVTHVAPLDAEDCGQNSSQKSRILSAALLEGVANYILPSIYIIFCVSYASFYSAV